MVTMHAMVCKTKLMSYIVEVMGDTEAECEERLKFGEFENVFDEYADEDYSTPYGIVKIYWESKE